MLENHEKKYLRHRVKYFNQTADEFFNHGAEFGNTHIFDKVSVIHALTAPEVHIISHARFVNDVCEMDQFYAELFIPRQ